MTARHLKKTLHLSLDISFVWYGVVFFSNNVSKNKFYELLHSSFWKFSIKTRWNYSFIFFFFENHLSSWLLETRQGFLIKIPEILRPVLRFFQTFFSRTTISSTLPVYAAFHRNDGLLYWLASSCFNPSKITHKVTHTLCTIRKLDFNTSELSTYQPN